jgi:hypothetical protein
LREVRRRPLTLSGVAATCVRHLWRESASRVVPRMVPFFLVHDETRRQQTSERASGAPEHWYCSTRTGSRCEETRAAHNPKVVGSNPTPATNESQVRADAHASALCISCDVVIYGGLHPHRAGTPRSFDIEGRGHTPCEMNVRFRCCLPGSMARSVLGAPGGSHFFDQVAVGDVRPGLEVDGLRLART